MGAPSSDLLGALLKNVSRSFYLTLRALPREIRSQIGLAYLLARTTDTIADTAIVPMKQRMAALQLFHERISGSSQAPLDFAGLAEQQAASAERALLERSEETLSLLAQFPSADQQRIRVLLEIIISGQVLDLQRFAGGATNQIQMLRTDQELEDYTYRVAGCVGEFWTKICRAHLFPEQSFDENTLLTNAVRFGKGLQLVNILRDLPFDLRQGRCYLPASRLSACNLTPGDLLISENEPRFRQLYHEYLNRAAAHLAAGWAYTNALPRSCFRLRLACALPLLIGANTLKQLRTANVLNPAVRVKVPRRDVRMLIVRSIACYPFPSAWNKLFPAAEEGGLNTDEY